jgi:DNA-binding response OmpR family regulator
LDDYIYINALLAGNYSQGGNKVESINNTVINALPGARILCVDEDNYSSEWVKRSLRSANVPAAIVSVPSGREAFALVNKESFDLCILEYPLPDMTGVQLCSLMRQTGSGVPVMFLTAMNRPIDREKAMSSGADDFLCKPDDLDMFVPAVKRLLKKRWPIYIQTPSYMSKAA